MALDGMGDALRMLNEDASLTYTSNALRLLFIRVYMQLQVMTESKREVYTNLHVIWPKDCEDKLQIAKREYDRLNWRTVRKKMLRLGKRQG